MAVANFTIDDTDPVLAWGPGWGVESPSDPALSNYFESTYHASRTPGANVSLFFSGVAVYVFGSKGPGHGNYSVRYDNLVQLFSARTDTLCYRQLLFSTNFSNGSHSITLTNTDNSQGWLDLDYITVASPGSSIATSGISSTISPPILLPSVVQTPTPVQASIAPLASSTAEASSQSNSGSNTTTLALAIVLGVLLFSIAVGVAWQFNLRRQRRRGTPSLPSSGESFGPKDEFVYAPETAFHNRQSTTIPYPYPPAFKNSPLDSSTTIYKDPPSSPSNSHTGADTRQQQYQERAHSAPVRAATPVRPWSPLSMTIGRMFGTIKEDGTDSMKSTFLKV